MNFVIFSLNFLIFLTFFFKFILFCFISFANLKLNQLTHTHTRKIKTNDTIQAGTPQQLAPIYRGPGTHKIASFFHPMRMGQ